MACREISGRSSAAPPLLVLLPLELLVLPDEEPEEELDDELDVEEPELDDEDEEELLEVLLPEDDELEDEVLPLLDELPDEELEDDEDELLLPVLPPLLPEEDEVLEELLGGAITHTGESCCTPSTTRTGVGGASQALASRPRAQAPAARARVSRQVRGFMGSAAVEWWAGCRRTARCSQALPARGRWRGQARRFPRRACRALRSRRPCC